jgi:hypothetical protein
VNDWWPAAPRPARIIALAGAVVLLYGTVVHVVELVAGGTDPYPTLPGWLAVYFVSLTVLDPLAAALLLQGRRSGLALSCAVLLTDAGANGYAVHRLDDSPGVTPDRVGHALLSLFALIFATAALRLRAGPGRPSNPAP